MADSMQPEHLLGHVQDAYYFEVPRFLASDGKVLIPQIFGARLEMTEHGYEAHGFGLSKFMVLEVVAALLLVLLFIPLARRMAGGPAPRGRLWNLFEGILLYLRDEVARPAIGKHDADKFLPFLWTLFFFVLTCNLLGMLPWSGSPTGALATTGALAAVAFLVTITAGMSKLGPVRFWTAQVPHMDLPLVLAVPLIPMMFAIEVAGLCIKHVILAVRLLANMFAGHVVLVVIVSFIAQTAGSVLWYGVVPASIFGATALSLLEILVAFLQAYIFTFLSALFIGMAVHPH
ncbi:MAG: F0F1 ATP synthase subunit A [Pirellulales bacterium]